MSGCSSEPRDPREDLWLGYLVAGGSLLMPLDLFERLDADGKAAAVRAGRRFWALLAARFGSAVLSPEGLARAQGEVDGGASALEGLLHASAARGLGEIRGGGS